MTPTLFLSTGSRSRRLDFHASLNAITPNWSHRERRRISLLEKWASGYLLKKSAGSELLKAVRDVLRGGRYIAPSLREALEDLAARDSRPDSERTLTARQREVLQLLAEGHTMKEAAAILNVATRTIAFHKYRIMQDFGLENNADLVRFAMRHGLINQA